MNTGNYVVYAETSISAGSRPRVMWASDTDIIEAADALLRHTDDSLEDMAGIEWVKDEAGDLVPARTLTYDEMLYFSVAALDDDGGLFQVFHDDDAGAQAFVECADAWGIGDEARALVAGGNGRVTAEGCSGC